MKTNRWLKIAGLFLTLLFAADMVSAQTNDSLVSLEADIAQLSLLPVSDIPATGTFWLVTASHGVTAPFPCAPPGIDSDNTYALPNGSFLVDGTAGETVSGELVEQMNSVSNLIVRAQAQATAMERRAMDDFAPPFPGGGDGGGGDTNIPPAPMFAIPDYGTNLYISDWGIASNLLVGVASNTIAVEYEYLTNGDLTTTNWGHTGIFTLGSSTTNWT